MKVSKLRSGTFRSGALAALAVGALCLTGVVSVGAANATTDASSSDVSRWVVPQTQEAGSSYWTSQRMMSATPGEVLVGDNVASAPSGNVKVGSKKSVDKQKADPQVTSVTPVDNIGKVFFTLGGVDYVCSGNAIASGNENTVVTAGHCVNEGPGAFASKFTFVPAYLNGSAPFGQWNATELYAPTNWASGGDITYDTGFAVVASPTGTSLSDTVGASGVSFNNSRGLTYSAYGYPAASPFNGQTLETCYGTATDDPYGQSESQGIPCDMTGGSSGGPWFIGSGSNGYQNSVNSYGYSTVRNTMFGPYWGSVIASTYDQASA